MADLNIIAASIKDIVSDVPGIMSAYDHEPQTIAQLPAVTLYFDSFSQFEETSKGSTVNWNFTTRIYVPMSTSDVSTPQLKLRELIIGIIKTLRTNITLNNTCLYHTISNGDVFAVLNQNNPMMVAELTLIATTKE